YLRSLWKEAKVALGLGWVYRTGARRVQVGLEDPLTRVLLSRKALNRRVGYELGYALHSALRQPVENRRHSAHPLRLVELRGIEPLTSSLRRTRTTIPEHSNR